MIFIRIKETVINLNKQKSLREISTVNTLRDLKETFYLLNGSSIDVQKAYIAKVRIILDFRDADRVIELEKIFRFNRYYSQPFNWSKAKPTNFVSNQLPVNDQILILGIASLHSNGYFREKAIIELNKFETGFELLFLLVRLRDWVPQVFRKAYKFVQNRITHKNAKYLIKFITILNHLDKPQKNDIGLVIAKMKDIISNTEVSSFIQAELELSSFTAQKKLLFHYLQKTDTELSVIIEFFKNERNPYTRFFYLKQMVKSYNFVMLGSYDSIFIKDNFFKIRLYWLELRHSIKEYTNEQLIELALLDRHESIRSTGRFLLKDKLDLRDICFNSLRTNNLPFVANLGAVGNQNDVEFLIPYLSGFGNRITKLALRGIASLDIVKNTEIFYGFLNSDIKKLSEFSATIILKNMDHFSFPTIFDCYNFSNLTHTKKFCMSILMQATRWESLVFVLQFLNNQNPEIQSYAKQLYSKWERPFTSLDSTARKEILDLIKNCKGLNESEKENLHLVVR